MRKIYSYIDTLESGLAKRRFGIDGFQILTLTVSNERIKYIQKCIGLMKNMTFSTMTFVFKIKNNSQISLVFHSDWEDSKGRITGVFD